MSDPKRHHWWPMCHSTLWTGDDGCIAIMNASGEVDRRRPKNLAVRKYYNSILRADGTRDASLETFFANEIEGVAGPVLARLATESRRDHQLERHYDKARLKSQRKEIKQDGFVPDDRAFSTHLPAEDRRALARYVASLIVRVPSYKDELNSERMRQDIATFLGLTSEEARRETDENHLEIVRDHLNDYSALLEQCAFVLLDAPDGLEFLIGDTPVIPAALGFGEAEAMCPIAPNRALFMIRGYRPPFDDRIAIFRSMPKSVKAFNKTMVQNAEREIFCRTPPPAKFVKDHLGTRQVRIVPKIGQGHVGKTRGPLLQPKAGAP
ncbi:DUF4238 domain-containing protein [Sphingopyxis sp. C-1]|uniref:DUF4238 domain-containing protein n=1 Tax=Sphingopyxis sp. C-1 TaxID=262667 RepID=UPI0006C13059|nr:DUF4238 domain-containing protein [Sphingopyxis sp. C-1]GAO77479.1 hypothetical protein SC1_00770 [Sphingopyxis sp. C-1]